jgi:Ca2+/Na+ antiporter
MLFLIFFFLFINLSFTYECSFQTVNKSEHIYLCREKLNATSLRVWLHLTLNKSEHVQNTFSYYIFTLRTLDLIDEHKINLKDRFEKKISNYTEINFNKYENNSIKIYNLSPGRYEICVNFFSNKNKNFYYRLPSSCLHIPWAVSEYEHERPNRLVQVSLVITIIILLVTVCFVIHVLHQYFRPEKPPVDTDNMEETEDIDYSERAKFLVNQHFPTHVNPFELLVRRRIHERYAHYSPDSNEM